MAIGLPSLGVTTTAVAAPVAVAPVLGVGWHDCCVAGGACAAVWLLLQSKSSGIVMPRCHQNLYSMHNTCGAVSCLQLWRFAICMTVKVHSVC
jgi:hypothetical protein